MARSMPWGDSGTEAGTAPRYDGAWGQCRRPDFTNTDPLPILLANPAAVPVETIPAVIGQLEQLKAALLSRLVVWSGLVVPPPKAPAPQCVKAKEIARMFDLPLGRVYELARTRRIPYIPVGKRAMRFDPEAVRKGLASLGLTE